MRNSNQEEVNLHSGKIFLISIAVTIIWCALFMSLTTIHCTHLNFILNSIGVFVLPAIFIAMVDYEWTGDAMYFYLAVIFLFCVSLYNLMDCAGIIHWLNS